MKLDKIDLNIIDRAFYTNDVTNYYYRQKFAKMNVILVNKLAGSNLYSTSVLSLQIEKGILSQFFQIKDYLI